MHPFMDPQTLTDDQIHDKLVQCRQYLGMQASLGHESAVHSIESVIISLELEQRNRFENSMNAEMNKQAPNLLDPINIGFTEPTEDDT